jgi:hypothetical protein
MSVHLDIILTPIYVLKAQIETALEKLNKAKSAISDDQDLEVVELVS